MSTIKTNAIQTVAGKPILNSTGSILQVVQTVRTGTESLSIASGAISGDLTGLTASITPSSTSNKILVSVGVNCSADSNVCYLYLYRGGAVVSGAIGDAAGSRVRVSATGWTSNNAQGETVNFHYLDAPSSTSALTYSLRIGHSSGITRTTNINYAYGDSDNATYARGISFITLMEVSG